MPAFVDLVLQLGVEALGLVLGIDGAADAPAHAELVGADSAVTKYLSSRFRKLISSLSIGGAGRMATNTATRDLCRARYGTKHLEISGAPNGIRIRAAGLKGRCPRPLDDEGARLAAGGLYLGADGAAPCSGGRPVRASSWLAPPSASFPAGCCAPGRPVRCDAPRRRQRITDLAGHIEDPAPHADPSVLRHRRSPALGLVAAPAAGPGLAHQSRALRVALDLLAALSHQVQSQAGKVAMLLPLGFDAAKGRRRFFADHPAFARKLILTRIEFVGRTFRKRRRLERQSLLGNLGLAARRAADFPLVDRRKEAPLTRRGQVSD